MRMIIRKSKKRNNTTITGGGDKTDITNNVYDLYGCHREWTLEADSTSSRACRGGVYFVSGSPASRDDYDPNTAGSNNSSRATLYIKWDWTLKCDIL